MNTSLKYCECPEPVETDQQFCDRCGMEYQDNFPDLKDRLAVGEVLDQYIVVERQRMWAVLEDDSGKRYRFWPTGDTTVPAVRPGEDTEQADLASDILDTTAAAVGIEQDDTPNQAPLEEIREQDAVEGVAGVQSEAEPPLQIVPVDLSFSSVENPSVDAPPQEQRSVSPEESSTAEPIEEADVLPEPSSMPAVTSSPPPVKLRHFVFLPATASTLNGVPGYLEAERPDKFTGTEVRSLRALMDADPTGEDMHPTRVLGWLVQCAQAMKSAHEQGILVNSFTPDTVFIDFDPAAAKAERIAISTALHAAPFDVAHPVAGYAPQGDEPLSPRADVYQVGTLLRDLMGWQSPPVWHDDGESVFRQPMSLVRLALLLMHHDPERRPDGAEALKRVLVETQQAFASQHVLDVAGITDMGLNREHNEDAYGFVQFEENAGRGQLSTTILVVCDGVGGTNAGEEASRLAVHEVLSALSAATASELTVPQRLEAALLQANTKLMSLSVQHRGAGCTIVTVYIRGQEYWVAHAGDSRAYVCVDGILKALTADHSWTAQQVRKGLMTAEEAQKHENAHMIYRSLGERDRLEVEVQPQMAAGYPLEPGSVFLLCTDGVTDVLDDDRLCSILGSNSRWARDKARHCVQAANAAGGPDNITALIAIQETTA